MDYDSLYLAGILFFNRQDYFEAHEVWEDLWACAAAPERRFYQGLIHAAVGLHHYSTGNVRGAAKLYRTCLDYLAPFPSPYLGLDTAAFRQQMERCFAPVLTAAPGADTPGSPHVLRPDPALVPVIILDPPPDTWPDLTAFESGEEEAS